MGSYQKQLRQKEAEISEMEVRESEITIYVGC